MEVGGNGKGGLGPKEGVGNIRGLCLQKIGRGYEPSANYDVPQYEIESGPPTRVKKGNTSRKDLSLLHLQDDPRVQVRQQA